MKRIIPRHIHYANEIQPSGKNVPISQIPPLDWTRMAFDSWETFVSGLGIVAQDIFDIIGEVMTFTAWTTEQIATVLGSWGNMVNVAALGLLDSTKLAVNYGKENQIYNGDFELDFNGDGIPDGWTNTVESGAPTFGRSETQNYKGKYSVYITTVAGHSGRFDSLLFPVQGNRKYVVTVCVKGSKTATSPYPVYDIRFYDANQAIIVEYTGDANVTTDWVQKSFVATSGNLARYAQVTLLNIGFNGTIYWDDVQCYEQKNVSDYLADALLPWTKLIQTVVPTNLVGTFGIDYALAKFANGFFNATTEGRGKFATQFVNEALIAVDAVTQSRIKNAEIVWDKLSADVKTKVSATAKWFSEAELNFSLWYETTIETDATASNLKCIRRLSGSASQTMWYGPYITLDGGGYWALFRMKVASNASSANLIYIDWNCTRLSPSGGGRQLHANDFYQSNVWQTFAIPVEINQNDVQIEFRGMYFETGITAVYCDYVALIPMAKISTDLIEAYAVTANKIKAYCITAHELHADCIEVDKILAGAVVSSKIALWRLTSDPTLLAGMLWWRSDLNEIRFFDGSTVYWIPKFPIVFNPSNIVAFTWTAFLTLCTSGLSALTSTGVIAPNAVNAVTQLADNIFSGMAGLAKFGANLFSGILGLGKFGNDLFSGSAGRAKFANDLALPFTKLEAVPYKLPTSAYNYIVNPSYEYGTWGGNSDILDDSNAKFGKYKLRLQGTGSNADSGLSNLVDLRGLTTITVSVWSEIYNYAAGEMRIAARCYDAEQTFIDYYVLGTYYGNHSWTQRTFTIAASSLPANTAFMRVYFSVNNSPSLDACLDGWQLNVGDQTPAFQDFTAYSYNWCPEKFETESSVQWANSGTQYENILELPFTCESTMLLFIHAYVYGFIYNNTGGPYHSYRVHVLTLDGVNLPVTYCMIGGYCVTSGEFDAPYSVHTIATVAKGSHILRIRMRALLPNTIAYALDRRLTILQGFYQGGIT